jgi:cytochrome c556
MRVSSVAVVSMFLVLAVEAQTAAPKKTAAPAQNQKKAVGTLAQVMRGVFFPNANLIFDVQANDPGAPSGKNNAPGGGASATFANIYTGWQVVENASLVLAETSDLLLYPGRLCQNGKPVPVSRADWVKYVRGMREAGVAALQVARTKNLEKMIDATNAIADACSNCHEPYRDKGDADSPARCTPPTAADMDRINKAQP